MWYGEIKKAAERWLNAQSAKRCQAEVAGCPSLFPLIFLRRCLDLDGSAGLGALCGICIIVCVS